MSIPFVDNLLKQQWFYLSPSPWSLCFYAIMTAYGMYKLRHSTYRATKALSAHPQLWYVLTAIDAFFIFAFVLMIQDAMWLLFNTLRFWPQYSSMMQLPYFLNFARDGVAALLFFILTLHRYGSYWSINWKTLGMFALYAAFLAFVAFALSTDPSMMDWTYAIRFSYSDDRILAAFLLSHVIGKIIIAAIVSTVWIKEANQHASTA